MAQQMAGLFPTAWTPSLAHPELPGGNLEHLQAVVAGSLHHHRVSEVRRAESEVSWPLTQHSTHSWERDTLTPGFSPS